jgi:hypothetical protein
MNATIRIALTGLFLGLAGAVCGQEAASPRALKSQLASGDGFGARVTVNESPELASVLDRSDALGGPGVRVYRITIFSDNSQNGRERAAEAMSRFQSAFPGIPVDRSYENPDWKVSAGYCLTPDEAAALFGQVKKLFPGAIPRETVFSVYELRNAQAEAKAATEMPLETPSETPQE